MELNMVNGCYHILENAGFCTHMVKNVYKLHPALRGYLLRQMPAPESIQKGFVEVMGRLSDFLTVAPLYQAKPGYQMNLVNFYHARRLAETQDMDRDYIALTQSLAHYAEEMRRFAEASKLYLANAQKAESSNYWKFVASAYHQLGNIALKKQDFVGAEGWYKKALEIFEKEGDEKGVATTYCQFGYIAQKQRDFASAETWYKKAQAIEEKQGDEHDVASTYHQLGMIAEEQGDFARAADWYKKVLSIKKKQGDEYDAASTYHQLGITAQKQGDFARAEGWYKRALSIKEKQGDEYDAASTYHQLGTIAQQQGDFAAAEAWYKKALSIKEKQGNEYDAASTYHQLGSFAQQQGDFVAAEAWCKKAMAIYERQGHKHGVAMTYHQLGNIAVEQRDFPQAGDFYLKSAKMFVNTNDTYNLMITIRSYARLLHTTAGTEHSQLRQAWSTCMSRELTNILDVMEIELNAAIEYSTYAKKSTILTLAQQDPGFTDFYLQYQDQIVLTTPLPIDFWDNVIAIAEKEPALSSAVKRCRENAQVSQTFAIPCLPEAGVLIAALFLLSAHIKIHRSKDGKWEFLLEHKASDDGILEKIAQILTDFFKN